MFSLVVGHVLKHDCIYGDKVVVSISTLNANPKFVPGVTLFVAVAALLVVLSLLSTKVLLSGLGCLLFSVFVPVLMLLEHADNCWTFTSENKEKLITCARTMIFLSLL